MSIILPRRRFLAGLASALAAPAIVRAENLMPVRRYFDPLYPTFIPGGYSVVDERGRLFETVIFNKVPSLNDRRRITQSLIDWYGDDVVISGQDAP